MLKFSISNRAQEIKYLALRDAKVKALKMQPLDKDISGIPFDTDMRISLHVTYRNIIGRGGFGLVYKGISTLNGDRRAVKTVTVRKDSDRSWIKGEIKGLKRCQSSPHVVKLFHIDNSLGAVSPWQEIPVGKRFHVHLVQELGHAFDKIDFSTMPLKGQLGLSRQLIAGVRDIHQKGMMHRDLTRANLLYFADGHQAKICDFGKVCFRIHDTEPALAAEQYLPPQVFLKSRDFVYGQDLDIWCLGQSLIRAFCKDAFNGCRVTPLNPRDKWEHFEIKRNLIDEELRYDFGRLLRSMMAWEPRDRPTAQSLLNHDAFRDLTPLPVPQTIPAERECDTHTAKVKAEVGTQKVE